MFLSASYIQGSYSSGQKIILLIFCLLFTVSLRAVRSAEEIKSVKADQILDTKQFNYLDKGSVITLQVMLPGQDKVVFESLMRIESTDKELYNLILSRSPQAGTELLWVCNSEVEKVQVSSPEDSISTDTMSVGFSVYFPADSVYISANEHSYAFSSHGIRSDRGYRFHILGDKRSHLKLLERHAELLSVGKEEQHLSAWYWILLIIVVDMIVFLGMHWRRRRQKRLKASNRVEILTSFGDEGEKVRLPRYNAVYLFGGLQVFDRNGEEVSQRFSPLLRELFVLLILRSAENGISSEELTTMLWFDKDDVSAKNNRAVNLSKLRVLVESVGGCTISKISGNWRVQFEKNAFVDYYECLPERIRPDSLTTERIKIIAALTAKGGLLNECDYLWLDAFKSRIADNLIESLLKYATLLDEHEAFDTKLLISDIIFRFDSVNEAALRLKCATYVFMRKQYMAKTTYEHFCREYKSLYDEPFEHSFNSIISQ